MIAIIDYGAGNIQSLKNALDYLGLENILTSKADTIRNADKIILPGVGAFPSAMKMLRDRGLVDVLKEEGRKKAFLGICLGMQMLFEKSYEFEECKGLGFIKGKIDLIEDEEVIKPHMGWNKLCINHENPLIKEESYVYFVHSYRAFCDDDKNLTAWCDYGKSVIPALVSDGGSVFGTQFHPEKSGEYGLGILKRFGELK